MAILEQIRQLYPQLTRSQKRLADFVVTSYQEAAFMRASRLARQLALNEATVIRFAQRLGYPGYPEMMQEIQALVRAELQPDVDSSRVKGEPQACLSVLSREIASLQRDVSHIAPEPLHGAVGMLAGARRILVLGQGQSAPLAQILSYALRTLGPTPVSAAGPAAVPFVECLSPDPSLWAPALDELGEQDVLVVIAITPEGQDVVQVLHYVRQRGASTLALAWSPIAPSAQMATRAISLPASERSGRPSTAAMVVLIDVLVQCLAAQDPERQSVRSDRLQQIQELVAPKRRR